MKKGFTLAELLITLGSGGVASALVAPAISDMVPDKSKILVTRSYNALATLTQNILEEEPVYYEMSNSADFTQADCIGLGCTHTPVIDEYKSYTGATKYGGVLAHHLNVGGAPTVTETSTEFEMSDGVICKVTSTVGEKEIKTEKGATLKKATLDSDIVLTVPDKKCTDFSATCKSPSNFKFKVDTFGTIKPVDALSKAYLENPLNMSQRKVDLKRALEILEEE